MGISNRSHGVKTDQETQSPMFKVFRDMVQRDKRDPEKTNLLSGKHVDKKRRHFSGYRSKSEQKSVDSSSSDLQHSYKHTEQELRNAEYHRSQSQSMPYQGSKSWVFWGEKECCSKKDRTNDDTCSCVSCALKKLIGSDYACVGCLALLFSISVIIACLLVYKCIPTISNTSPKHDSGRLKRKIESINGWGSFMPKTFGGFNKHKWQDSSIRDLGMIDTDSELLKIIDDTKLNEIQSSSRLREFYKKLLIADSNIRKLKKSTEYTTFDTNFDFGLKSLPEREKRSVKFLKKPFKLFHHGKRKSNKTTIVQNNKNEIANLTKAQNPRHKRFGNNSEDRIVIEKDRVLIQYKPRIVPKCSHNIPKDLKSHEHLLKHPFYKNTQRLDELLDHFNNHLPEIINDQFGLNFVFDDHKIPYKHMKVNAGDDKNKMAEDEKIKMAEKPKEKVDTKKYQTDYDMFRKMRNGNPNMEGAKTNGYADFDGDTLKRKDISTNNFDVLLTISTILNQKRTTPYQDQMQRIPNLRRLLQADVEEEESINYEDLKEVLTDDNQEHDDSDKKNRKKRLDDFNPYNLPTTKYHPPNVNNPNWKGPMPLYPDEINSMIKQGPVVVNKAERPVNGEEINELSDLDYIEDYLNNKCRGLVELAQAYSDYGVLSDKKPATQKGTNKKSENRKKILLGGKDAFGRHKKSKENEGLRFEIIPTTTAREDKPQNLRKFIEQHVRFTNNLYKKPTYVYSTVTLPRTGYTDKRYFMLPSLKEKRSPYTQDGSILQRVSLEKGNNRVFTDLLNDKVGIDNRNKKEFENNKNDLSKQRNDIVTETRTLNNLNEKIIIENDNSNDRIVFKKRSLKYSDETNSTKQIDVEIRNLDSIMDNSETKINEALSKDSIKSESEVNKELSKENVSYNHTKRSDMDLSDFFMIMSNIFSAMDGEYVATEPYNTSNTIFNSTKASTPKTTDIIYPMYDSEMMDNIGHRSRVLLSINSTDGVRNDNEGAFEHDDGKKLIINITNPNLSINKDSIKNRTARIVKRHADGNTIFWNDIYDDEYGVKMDVFENIKDKSSAANEFMRRSNEWIQDKVRKISDNFHRSKNDDENDGKRVGRSVWNSHDNGNGRHSYYIGKNNKFNRKIRNSEEDIPDKKTDFSALTVHMKDVCRRAANAVKESTENIEISAKEDKENAATTSLMHHLVSLMTDLIDFQVEQRTCMKLPPDLYSFLDWLTDVTPKDSDDDSPNNKLMVNNQPGEIKDEKPLEHPSDMPSERDDQDPRSDCLGTLQAIQDLLRSFEDMPESDKSKMTGVKDYLLNQIKYLKKRLADEEYTSGVEQYPLDPYRFRRHLPKSRGRHHHKYLKNYSKKHTKTTASYYDGVTFTEAYDVLTRKKIKEKRNLRDIYYRAVADAKKITTIIFNTKD